MGLSLSKLEKIRRHGRNIIARCPACAEIGHDRKGEHLFIEPSGKFGCVVYPGLSGHAHRQRIFELTGEEMPKTSSFTIKKPLSPQQNIVQKNILGRLGHTLETHARNELNFLDQKMKNKDNPKTPVPSVPDNLLSSFTPNELKMLEGIESESLALINDIKNAFNGTVTRIINTKP